MTITCEACHTNFDAPSGSADAAACPFCEHVNRPRGRAAMIEPTHLLLDNTAEEDDLPVKGPVTPPQGGPRKTEPAKSTPRPAVSPAGQGRDQGAPNSAHRVTGSVKSKSEPTAFDSIESVGSGRKAIAGATTEEGEVTRPRPKSRSPQFPGAVCLTVVEEGQLPRQYVVDQARVVMGRGKCDIRVYDPEVSRQHCAIENRDGVAILRDLDSVNGTVLNGHLVNEHALKPGDQITIGSTVLNVSPAKAA